MKSHVMSQMENVSDRIWHLPSLSERRLQVEMLIAPHQRIVEQLPDAFRLIVGADSRIQIRWAALNDHHQRVARWLAMAGSEKKDAAERAKDARPPSEVRHKRSCPE